MRIVLPGLAALAIIIAPAIALGQQSPVRSITRSFQDMERSLCRSFDLRNCPPKKALAKPRTQSGKQRANAKPDKRMVAPDTDVDISTNPPIPRQRPEDILHDKARQEAARPQTPNAGKTDLQPPLAKSEILAKNSQETGEKSLDTTPVQDNLGDLSAAAAKGFIDKKDQSRLVDGKVAEVPKPVLRRPRTPEKAPAAMSDQNQSTKPDEEHVEQKSAAVTTPRIEAVPAPKPSANCLSELAALGAKFTLEAAPVSDGKCSIATPVRLTGLQAATTTISFPDKPLLNCQFALQFSKWARGIAGPLAIATTGQQLSAIATGPGYECRNRNGDASGKTSEHGMGNAVDIESFKLADGKRLVVKTVANPADPDRQTLQAFRTSACEEFTTVLGPGSNSAHEEHFHFDLGQHGKSGTYRICE